MKDNIRCSRYKYIINISSRKIILQNLTLSFINGYNGLDSRRTLLRQYTMRIFCANLQNLLKRVTGTLRAYRYKTFLFCNKRKCMIVKCHKMISFLLEKIRYYVKQIFLEYVYLLKILMYKNFIIQIRNSSCQFLYFQFHCTI